MNDPARLLELIDAALTLEPDVRHAFLDRECAGDESLRRRLSALIDSEAYAERYARPLTLAPRDRSGESVGAWRLLREIGRGGMGAVYLAERADGLHDKRVAMKFLRFDVPDLRARLANERRFLAMLDHPNIARFVDAGFDVQSPYFAMEYVEGEPITAWCDARELDLRARIRLMLKVLDAVQSAHGYLVVHRDLKPANILVDAHGEPKLLDFGIAKLLGDATHLTQTGFAPLTPDYASPEQVRGDPIGVASDIYSLGMMLYELIAGRRPYTLTSMAPAHVVRMVCETPLDPPSKAAKIHIDRDLDSIVLRTLAKEPLERYATCAQFADDLQRYLDGRPVQAVQGSRRYRAAKFLRRHRKAVAVAVVIALVLLTSTGVALFQANRARAQSQVAQTERRKSDQINTFLRDMLAAADPDKNGRDVTVAAVLDAAASALDAHPPDDAESTAAMHRVVAETYFHLGILESAVKHARAAAQLMTATTTASSAERAASFLDLGEMLASHDDAEAARWLRAAIDADAGDSVLVASVENSLGQISRRKGDPAAAADHYERALAAYESSSVRDDDGRASVLVSLAVLRAEQGDVAASTSLAQRALVLVRALEPPNPVLLSRVLARTAYVRKKNGDLAGADADYSEALAIETQHYGAVHPETIMTLANLAGLRTDQHRYSEAVALARRAYDAARENLPAPHIQTANAALALGVALYGDDRRAESVAPLREADAIFRQLLPADSPLIARTQSALGLALAQAGDADGERLLRDAVERLQNRQVPAPDDRRVAEARLAAFEKGTKYQP